MARPLAALLFGSILVLGSVPARGQLTAAPESLRVTVPQEQDREAVLTLTNAGGSPVRYCLDFDAPLQRRRGGSTCSPPGEVLFGINRHELNGGIDGAVTHNATQVPDGRLFFPDYSTASGYTHVLSAGLAYLGGFPDPRVWEVGRPIVLGVTYNDDTGTLWWLNVELQSPGSVVLRSTLIEGTLDGVATGRRIVLPRVPAPPPEQWVAPVGVAYDAAAGRYYLGDYQNRRLWAVDTMGQFIEGYPRPLGGAYAAAFFGFGLSGNGEGEGLRLEIALAYETGPAFVGVVDGEGNPVGTETPLPPFSGSGGPSGNLVRSRLDPNGLMYGAFSGFDEDSVLAFRPAPVAPSWLGLSAWNGDIEPGQSAEVALTFRSGERAVGENRATLVVEDTSGAVLASVPLTLDVTEGTATENDAPAPGGFTLSVAQNPARGSATITLGLPRPGAVRVALYDVLGRAAFVLQDGPLTPGPHSFTLEASRLAPGVYVVRAEGPGVRLARPLTVVR